MKFFGDLAGFEQRWEFESEGACQRGVWNDKCDVVLVQLNFWRDLIALFDIRL